MRVVKIQCRSNIDTYWPVWCPSWLNLHKTMLELQFFPKKAPPTLSPCIIYNPKSLRTALLSWSLLANLWTWMKNRFRPTSQCSDIDLPAGFNVFLWLETAQDSVNMTWWIFLFMKHMFFLFYETYTAAVILYDYLPLSDFNILSFNSR